MVCGGKGVTIKIRVYGVVREKKLIYAVKNIAVNYIKDIQKLIGKNSVR